MEDTQTNTPDQDTRSELTSRFCGHLLATHFAKCLRAEVDGQPAPDPYDTLNDDNDKMRDALRFVGGLLGTCDCRAHTTMLERVMAALADMIGGQGAALQMFLERVRDPERPIVCGVRVEELGNGGIRMVTTVEMPDFDDDPHLAAKQAAETVREIINGMIEPLTSAVMDRAGFSVDEIRRRGPAAAVDVEVVTP